MIGAALTGGCGKDDSSKSSATQTSDTVQADTGTATTPAPSIRDTSQKPVIPKPTGAVPRKLKVHDIVKGKGPAAKTGDELTVQFVGVTFSTGEQFESSWDSGQPFSFQLGGDVIEGWNRGLKGMRKGGRRELTIPPTLAYGAQGSPPSIGPNEPLVYVIDLVGLR